ncbi:MAG: DUF87 domain-containing protein [Phycisphaerae bacterium]|nr:DUF87 domain-containing protein [Phycisphaerae bacterium]
MMLRVQELCRKLQPILGKKIDALWRVYLAQSDADGKADIEQTLELLAAKHLGTGFQPDRSPFPPPSRQFAKSGDTRIGQVSYGHRELYPFLLKSGRLKEHILVAGRSGSGKTNLTFVLMQGIMARDIKVVAMDWKRGYRDLLQIQPDLRVYTIGRSVAPFRFNPLIPPKGCEPGTWMKLTIEVIASAYLGGEGVISLLMSGLHHLYSKFGVFDGMPTQWPTIIDLLAWLRTVKLKGRAAMWQASAERILVAMTYGEFGAVVNTQDNSHVEQLLDHNVVLEMDGLSSSSDRAMFSEALTLYLYRFRLGQGPRSQLTNLIVLEEAHHVLARRAIETKESVLETSIRMIRQYGLGYVFVDQSASLLSKVAFANSYATLALSQKLRADVQTMTGAMNLTEEQRDALSTLPIGTAVVRLADEHPEAFLVKIPRCPIREGSVSDDAIRRHMAAYSGESTTDTAVQSERTEVSPVPSSDKKKKPNEHQTENTHPPSPRESRTIGSRATSPHKRESDPPEETMSREEIRFLADVASRPLSTTVSRYQRLHLSRRRGNAIRQSLATAGHIESVPLATRSGQVVLNRLTDDGRSLCSSLGIDSGPRPRTSLEHAYWAAKSAKHFERKGYDVSHEYSVKGNGTIDLLAERPGERVAVEVETGKSDVAGNLAKLRGKGFDRIVMVATSSVAVSVCEKAINERGRDSHVSAELLTWLDIS